MLDSGCPAAAESSALKSERTTWLLTSASGCLAGAFGCLMTGCSLCWHYCCDVPEQHDWPRCAGA